MTMFKASILICCCVATFITGYNIALTNCDNKKPANTLIASTPKNVTDSIWHEKTTTKIVYIKSDNEMRKYWYLKGALAYQYESPYSTSDKDLQLKIQKHFKMDSALIP